MKPTRRRETFAVFKAERELYRSLCVERARIVARLRELETQQMVEYIAPTFPQTAEIKTAQQQVD